MLWIVNHYAQAPDGAGPVRHYSLARRLAELGWTTIIIASSVELNTGRQRLPPGRRAVSEDHAGVVFRWLRSPGYRDSGLARIWNMLHFSFGALGTEATAGLPAPDLVLGSSVHPLAAWSAERLARRHRVPFVFEIRDLWPEVLVAMGRLARFSPATLLLRRLEASLCRRAAAIVAVVPFAADYLGRYGVADKVIWIPHGVDAEFMSPVPRAAPGTFTLTYLGAHGPYNSLDTLIDAMAIVRRDPAGGDVRCQLVGAGPSRDALRRRAAELELDNVAFRDPVPRREVSRIAAETDAFVLCTLDLPGVFRYGVSMNKLYDYMAMGRPAILALAARNNPVAEANAGMTVAPRQPAALAEAILALARTPPAEREAMGERARRHARENYDYAVLARRLAERLERCLAAA